MPFERFDRRRSLIVLCAGLLVVTLLFGVPATYTPAVNYSLALLQIAVVSSATWFLGASAVRSEVSQHRQLALVGALLVLPWILFSFCAGFGPPHQATVAQNHLRYIVLLVSAIAIAGGLIVLREALSGAGERFYSTLGFAAILLASSLYLVWASIAIEVYSMKDLVGSDPPPPWATFLHELANILLFFGGALTYGATAAFAVSLERAHWLGRGATRAFVAMSLLAVLSLVIRGFEFPDPTAASTHGYQIPGIVFGIPAVPWIMPCIFGVVLLRRAGNESQESRSPQTVG
jgi:hypothetical protein